MISSVPRRPARPRKFMANLAAANVMHRKTRTAVSVLAVAVEVAMVMLLVGMANGTLGDIAERLQNVGADVLFQPPDASLILGATSAVMPVKYADLIKEVDGVTEATPVLNWLVAKIKGESRAVNLWAIDYPTYARISGGFDLVEGRPLSQPYDLVMDTVLADATAMRVGDMLPMLNHEFRLAGITRAGAGPELSHDHRDTAGVRHPSRDRRQPGQSRPARHRGELPDLPGRRGGRHHPRHGGPVGAAPCLPHAVDRPEPRMGADRVVARH